MALKPVIYKFSIDLADMNREVYDHLNLTVARHPSETAERMLVRVLAYCLNSREGLSFTKGLSEADEPDLWAHALHGSIDLWIEVGEPAPERIKKASRIAKDVKIYPFNHKAPVWWTQNRDDLAPLKATIVRFAWEDVERFAALLDRTMTLSISLSGETAYITAPGGACEVNWEVLQAVE